MSTDSLIISISVAIVACAFIAIVIFLAIILLSLRRTILDMDDKIQAFAPLARFIFKIGDLVEKKEKGMSESEDEISKKAFKKKDRCLDAVIEVVRWALVGVAIWQKLKEKK
ncbi:MAG: DUF948 domain-containing protein [Chlamydiales bacterium]